MIPALALLMELLRELANAGEELTEAGLPVAHSKAIEERAAGTAARSADFGETVYAAHSAAAVQRFAATDHLRQFAKMFQTAPVPVYSHLCVERSSLDAVYGMDDAILRDGRQFLSAFPRAPQRVHVALLMADSYARKDMEKEELALYDQLLTELAARADHVPSAKAPARTLRWRNSRGKPTSQRTRRLRPNKPPSHGSILCSRGRPSYGSPASGPATPPSALPIPPSGHAHAACPCRRKARSPEYSQVLELYVSRLVALGRPLAVLDLFRREIDHNPNDPGLYERLATFLEQNRMDERIEAVYKKALQQFPDRSWYQKLARWYLRRHERQQFEELSRQVIQNFPARTLRNISARWFGAARSYRGCTCS